MVQKACWLCMGMRLPLGDAQLSDFAYHTHKAFCCSLIPEIWCTAKSEAVRSKQIEQTFSPMHSFDQYAKKECASPYSTCTQLDGSAQKQDKQKRSNLGGRV